MGTETESTVTATQVAKEIGIDKSTLSKWRTRPGCPPLEAGGAAIKRWHDDTFLDRGPKLFDDDENDISLDDVDFTLPQGSDATDVLARIEKSERRLAGMIEAWEGQKLTPKQSSKLACRRSIQNRPARVESKPATFYCLNRGKMFWQVAIAGSVD
jgi:hypothetical protein